MDKTQPFCTLILKPFSGPYLPWGLNQTPRVLEDTEGLCGLFRYLALSGANFSGPWSI